MGVAVVTGIAVVVIISRWMRFYDKIAVCLSNSFSFVKMPISGCSPVLITAAQPDVCRQTIFLDHDVSAVLLEGITQFVLIIRHHVEF